MGLDPTFVVSIMLCLIFSLSIHEAAHAAMAYRCGDDTAKHLGRLTLNPIAHIDLLGTIILPLIMISTMGMMFGWAKPVPFQPHKLNNPRLDPVFIAMAGPALNLLIAIVVTFVARGVVQGMEEVPPFLSMFLPQMILLNLILMVFNLIPVPPLDGHHVLNYFLPPEGQRFMQRIGPFGLLIAILLARPLISRVIPPMMELVSWAVHA